MGLFGLWVAASTLHNEPTAAPPPAEVMGGQLWRCNFHGPCVGQPRVAVADRGREKLDEASRRMIAGSRDHAWQGDLGMESERGTGGGTMTFWLTGLIMSAWCWGVRLPSSSDRGYRYGIERSRVRL